MNRDFGLKNAHADQLDAFAANIVSLLQAGCFFGSLAAAPMGDKFGRKITLIITGVVFVLGSIMQVASMGNTAAMFVGRAIGGLVSSYDYQVRVGLLIFINRVSVLQVCLYHSTSQRCHHPLFEDD